MNPPPSYDYKVSVLSGGEEVPMTAQHGGQSAEAVLSDPRLTLPDKIAVGQVAVAAATIDSMQGSSKDHSREAGVTAAISETKRLLERRSSQDAVAPIQQQQTSFSRMTSSLSSEIASISEKPVKTEFYLLNSTTQTPYFKVLNERVQNIVKNPEWHKKYMPDVNNYIKERKALWESSLNRRMSTEGLKFPTIKTTDGPCPETITDFHRYVHILPVSTQTIILIPPLMDLESVDDIIEKLDKLDVLEYTIENGKDKFYVKDKCVLIFMPNFFGELNKVSEMALILFTFFLDLYRDNKNKVFILCTNNSANCVFGTKLANLFADPTGPVNKEIISMLEPSYIVYPYSRKGLQGGILISGSSATENVNFPKTRKLNAFNLTKIRTDPRYGKECGFLLSTRLTIGATEEAALNLFTIRGNYPEGQTLQLKNPDPKCADILQSKTLDNYRTTKIKLDKIYPQKDVILAIQVGAGSAKLCGKKNRTKSKTVGIGLKQGEGAIAQPVRTVGRRETTQGSKVNMFEKFVGHPQAGKSEHVVQVELNGSTYTIRNPTLDEKVSARVLADWTNPEMPRLTRGEADFLNALNLRPHILQEIFKGDTKPWEDHLKDFLQTMVLSNCLTDQTLLMKRECLSCRMFLKKVRQYYVNHNIEIDLIRQEEENKIREQYKKDTDEVFFHSADEIISGQATSQASNQVTSDQVASDLTSEVSSQVSGQPALTSEEIQDLNKHSRDTTMNNKKTILGELTIYINPTEKTANAVIIGVNTKLRTHKFYEVSIPNMNNPEENRRGLLDRIKRIKEKYLDYIFFY